MRPLHVVKVGSATLARATIHDEIADLARTGARVLLVTGGAEGIERHYARTGRSMPMLTLANGDRVRHASPAEMEHVTAAYEQVVLPEAEAALRARGCSVHAATAARGGLVRARANRPLKVLTDSGRTAVVRDQRVGVPTSVDVDALGALLEAFDVVCLAPPVADDGSSPSDADAPLNVDADVLAAHLALALGADHVRLVTGTAGLLRDPADPTSTVRDLHAGDGARYAGGRMRQKVRAAELALGGAGDVVVCGPHTMADRAGWSRFWPTEAPAADLELLTQAASIPSVSGDEQALAEHLRDWCLERGIDASVDAAGNLVATRGTGEHRLLLLGHLDTVPFTWPAQWQGDALSARGSVDAKAGLVNFLEVLADAHVPDGCQLRVVGAVEEEVSSSKGAFHVRDHYPADAVVIGEPSGAGALTLGYFGLFKVQVTVTVPAGHSAGMHAVSPADALVDVVSQLRLDVEKEAPGALTALIDVRVEPGRSGHRAVGVLNTRVPPGVDVAVLEERALAHATGTDSGTDSGTDYGPATGDAPGSRRVAVEVLRATPGHSGGRTTSVAKAFLRSFRSAGQQPRFLVKKGTSDMNTLATTWTGVPMVAYGPGDSALDHTDHEHVLGSEVRLARSVLAGAVDAWFALAASTDRGEVAR